MARCLRWVCALVLSCAGIPLHADALRSCERLPLAEWEVHLESRVPLVSATVGPSRVTALLDTGAGRSVLSDAAAGRLGLVARTTTERMRGIGGDSVVRAARLEELRIGAWSRRALPIRVAAMRLPGVDLVLGNDVLATLDLELDLGAQRIRVFDPEACVDASPGEWEHQLPLERDEGALVVAISVNGRSARAMLDTGAARTVVSLDLAYAAGLAPDAPGVRAACMADIAGEAVPSWLGRFDALDVAGETLRDIELAFADFVIAPNAPLVRAPALSFPRRSPDVLLGNDFLAAHRVLVRHREGRVYFTRTRRDVFAPEGGAGACEVQGR